jgi:uncharacterized protein YaaN involved in tellurite resistance
MRGHLDELNPGKQGDLFQPRKLLGFIPFGNKLENYFRKYQGASGQLQKSMQQLYAARDDMQRDVVDLEATRGKLWDGMQRLSAAIHFAETLDARLHGKVEALKATDPVRAKALEQEVLFMRAKTCRTCSPNRRCAPMATWRWTCLKRPGGK